VIATGAGSEARQALGTAVFAGMLGVTLFGLLLTPAFYVICRRLALWRKPPVRRPAIDPPDHAVPPIGASPAGEV
jgi:HAE1 family hydrophobic/amphiphilic exporter-1